MEKPLLTIRCPEDVQRAIEEQMKTTARGKTEVVVALLRQALGLVQTEAQQLNGLTLDERIESIVAEKTEFITRQMNELLQQQSEAIQQIVEQLERRLAEMEKL